MGGPDGEGRSEGESALFMEGNPNADAPSDSDSSSNSKMNPPGEMLQGDGIRWATATIVLCSIIFSFPEVAPISSMAC